MRRPGRKDQAASIGGLVERWYCVIEGWSNPRAWTILDARGRSPMCDRVASPLLGRGAGGRSPGYLYRESDSVQVFGPRAMSDASPSCAEQPSSANRPKFMGSRAGSGFLVIDLRFGRLGLCRME